MFIKGHQVMTESLPVIQLVTTVLWPRWPQHPQ